MRRRFPETPEEWQRAVDEAQAHFDRCTVELFETWRTGGDVRAVMLDQTLLGLDADLRHDEVLERGEALGYRPRRPPRPLQPARGRRDET